MLVVQEILCANGVSSSQRQISFDTSLLKALPIELIQRGSRRKVTRPKSPVKLLSTMLGNVSGQSDSPHKGRPRALTGETSQHNVLSSGPILDAPTERGFSEKSPIKQVRDTANDGDRVKTSLSLLEDTFVAYVVALRSRSGNVVGKILQTRSTANELTVNELYNALLEDPARLEAAAVVSVDVLFAAFEKFLRMAWRESMGPILAPPMIQGLQSSFDMHDPKTFRFQFRQSFEELSPQNKRAFAATLRLLSDLLDASGNDGDRGVLIASFTEALVLTGNPHDYITLFDRLTEDYDTMFDGLVEHGGYLNSHECSSSRNRSVNTNSVGSNTSSLRRRFGFGSNSVRDRDDNRIEPESKVAAIWRTLSKNSRSPGESILATNVTKTSLIRSKSTDTDVRMGPPSRPLSRDRPLTSESNESADSTFRLGSSHLNTSGPVSTGQHRHGNARAMLRKKRRSSLSDLHALKNADDSLSVETLNFNRSGNQQPQPEQRTSNSPSGLHRQQPKSSPQRSGIPRFATPDSKENTPKPARSPTKHISRQSGSVTITSYTPVNRPTPVSQLPTPRAGLTERAWLPNGENIAKEPGVKSSTKMRLQSPQKIRQRLSQEQKHTTTADSDLQTEMNKIGEELSLLRSRPGSLGTISKSGFQSGSIEQLTHRLDAVQAQLTSMGPKLSSKEESESPELQKKLLASEKKIAKLDELYREANAENEALYERFNDELGKIVVRIRRGEGVDVLRSKLFEVQTDAQKLKSENAGMKREIVELQSLLQSK